MLVPKQPKREKELSAHYLLGKRQEAQQGLSFRRVGMFFLCCLHWGHEDQLPRDSSKLSRGSNTDTAALIRAQHEPGQGSPDHLIFLWEGSETA